MDVQTKIIRFSWWISASGFYEIFSGSKIFIKIFLHSSIAALISGIPSYVIFLLLSLLAIMSFVTRAK